MTGNTKDNIMTDNTNENIMTDNIVIFNTDGFIINGKIYKYSKIPYMSPEELKVLSKLPDEILDEIDNYYKSNN